jgi:uncharacterized membrane protein
MQIKLSNLISIVIIVLSFGVALYFYPSLPDTIVSHWGSQGEPNGQSSKAFGLFFMPILITVLTGLFLLIPKIDPLKKNIEEFRDSFDWFIVAFGAFMLYVYVLTVVWNAGYLFNMIKFMAPAFALLFYYVGVMIGRTKRNYFIGIRTPWTLANDKVWEKTHKLGGLLFKISALVILLVYYNTCLGLVSFVAYLVIVSIFLIVYSYYEFTKQKTN